MTEMLPQLTPDAARGARTIARCYAELEAHRRRLEERARTPDPRVVAAERLLLAGACVAYIVSMAGDVLRMIDLR